MAETRTLIALTILLIVPAASGLKLNVDVEASANHSVRDVQFKENVQDFQEFDVSVENIGSIACEYRLKAEFTHENEALNRYSNARGLWQGEYTQLSVGYVPVNYTGTVETDLFIHYCGLEEKIGEYKFNVTEKTLLNNSIGSRTVQVSENNAKIEIEEGEMLVPVEEPPYWRTGPAKVENGTAELEYKSTVFDERETIRYAVLDQGDAVGTTEVRLEPSPTLIERIIDRKFEVAAVLLVLSLLINLLLVLKLLKPEKFTISYLLSEIKSLK
jgi:hypothetical protein